MRLALALFLCAGTAAASPKPFHCSAQGGRQWREVKSAHFIVDTDATGGTLSTLVQSLENYLAKEIFTLLGGPADLPGRLRVVAFSSPSEFVDLAGSDLGGYYWHSDLYGPYIVLPLAGFTAHGETVAHELAHYLSFFLFPAQPHWFTEGFAQWVETIANGDSEHRAPTGSHIPHGSRARYAAGMASPYLVAALASAPQVPGKELLEWKGKEDTATPWRYHAWSWILYHWLWNARSPRLADYQQRLMNGEDPAEAWRAAMPDLDPGDPAAMKKLDAELHRYRETGRFVALQIDAKGGGDFVEVGKLPSADVHMLLSQIRRAHQGTAESAAQIEADTAEALTEDPLHPVALWQRSQSDPAARLDLIRKSVAERPRDARAQLILADTLMRLSSQDALAALRRALELEPDNAWAQGELALALLRAGKPREAIPPANRAVDLAPWDPRAVDALARVAAAVGKCKEAVALERREIWLLENADAVAKLNERIAADAAACESSSVRAAPKVEAATTATK
jgi:tetratricopeptide (TPR) repeat protein